MHKKIANPYGLSERSVLTDSNRDSVGERERVHANTRGRN